MNTPNKITLARILLIPLIVFFYLADFIPYARLVATILFIVACLTDFVDGHLARKTNQVTDLGKFFDSIADKVLISTGLILICAVPVFQGGPAVFPNWLGVICVVIILAREFIVSALRQIAAAKGLVLAADKGGKIKATFQFVICSLYMAFAFVLTDILPNPTANIGRALGVIRIVLMALLVLTTFLTIYSGASYLIKNRRVFKTDKNDNFVNDAVEEDDEIDIDNHEEV